MTDPPILELPDDFRSNAFHDGACQMYQFSEKHIMPALRTNFKISKSDRDHVIVGIYALIHECLETVTLMNRVSAIQGVGSSAKTLFELAIDLKLLCDDKTNASTDKYFAYAIIDRHKTSQKLLKFHAEKNAEPELTMDEGLQSRIKQDEVIKKLIATNWPELSRKSPRHWSGIPSALDRAKRLGLDYERLYYEIYSVMNWHDHSSPASWIEMSFSQKHSGYQTAIICVMRLMTIILDTIRKEFGFDVVVQDFTQKLYKLWFGPMEAMVKELAKMKAEGKFSGPEPTTT